jgi:hypothetical protein
LQIQTSLTQTVEAASTSTLIPTETAIPSNLQSYVSSEFNFSFLYSLDASHAEFEPFKDILISMNLTFPDPSRIVIQPPETSVTVFANPDSLSVSDWLNVQRTIDPIAPESGFARYQCVGVPQVLKIDDHNAIIFNYTLGGAGGRTVTKIVVEREQHIVSIGMIEDQSGAIRELFTIIASSFQFDTRANTLVVDSELQNNINQILDVLGPAQASGC